jgi:hypothetical protein
MWSTSDGAVATVDSTGLVTALKQGAVTISATSGTATGNAVLTVDPPNLLSVSVSPQNPTLVTGQTQQFTATGSYTDGSTQVLNSVAWSSSNATVGTVSNAGLARGLVVGTTTIGATSGSIGGSTTLSVAHAITYPTSTALPSGGIHPEGVVVADFNGDGKLDIAVSYAANAVAVFINDGLGNFGSPIITPVPVTAVGLGSLAVGDFDGDGKADLVVATIGGSQASIVLLGNGDGTFSQQAPIPSSFGFLRAKVIDLNGDGRQDLVFAMNGTVAVSMGHGDGTFAATTQLPAGSFPGTYFGIAVADFTGDGKLDIAALDSGSPNAGVGKLDFYPGNGDGTFVNPTSVDLMATFPASLANGDFNGDGKQDILIGFPNSAVIAFGNGDGTFAITFPNTVFVYSNNLVTTNGGITVFASDLTNTGKVDAVTADFDTGTLQITLNGALGNFPPFSGIFSFALAPGLSGIAAGDLNGDGVLDVVVVNYQTGEVTTVLSKIQ